MPWPGASATEVFPATCRLPPFWVKLVTDARGAEVALGRVIRFCAKPEIGLSPPVPQTGEHRPQPKRFAATARRPTA